MTTPTKTYGYVDGHKDEPAYIVYTDKGGTQPIIAQSPYGAVEFDNAYDLDGNYIPTYLKDGTPYLGKIVTYAGRRMRDPIESFPGLEPGTDPEEPGTDPEEPGTDPEEPGTDPEEPGTDPEEPGTDPEEPGTDPEEPGTDPEEPGTDPEEPPYAGVLKGMPTVAQLKAYTDDVMTEEQAKLVLDTCLALVEGYTRGNHVDRTGQLRPGIGAVLISAASRIIANPSGISRSDQAGAFSTRRGAGFSGFTLAEQAVLNRYRKRALG